MTAAADNNSFICTGATGQDNTAPKVVFNKTKCNRERKEKKEIDDKYLLTLF